MPVLGRGGILQVKRNAPVPAKVLPANINTTTDTIASLGNNFVTGDLVTLTSTGGNLPVQGAGSTANYYIYVDELGRTSLYNSKADSYFGTTAKRVPLTSGSFTNLTSSLVISDWEMQGYLREWSLSLDASEIDITAIGEKFSENMKNIISGGGTLDFLVHRRISLSSGSYDSMFLINLFLMTDSAAEISSKFYLSRNGKTRYIPDGEFIDLPGNLFYEAKIILTQLSINTRADDIIAGTANFVTTGPIYFRNQALELA